MNLRQPYFAPNTEGVLNELVQPLAGYIGATTSPPNTLAAALAILFDNLRQIDAETTCYLATFCKNRNA
jgi:hypothetical protein